MCGANRPTLVGTGLDRLLRSLVGVVLWLPPGIGTPARVPAPGLRGL